MTDARTVAEQISEAIWRAADGGNVTVKDVEAYTLPIIESAFAAKDAALEQAEADRDFYKAQCRGEHDLVNELQATLAAKDAEIARLITERAAVQA